MLDLKAIEKLKVINILKNYKDKIDKAFSKVLSNTLFDTLKKKINKKPLKQ